MRFQPAKLFLAFFALIIGLTLGVLVATLHFLVVLIKFPLDVYKTASRAYDERNEETKADIWTKHIERMDKKYGRDGENRNL
tara:strand:- start:111 stop:356 length:246 start_codon:yes stop_codon:yes gene_type:complete